MIKIDHDGAHPRARALGNALWVTFPSLAAAKPEFGSCQKSLAAAKLGNFTSGPTNFTPRPGNFTPTPRTHPLAAAKLGNFTPRPGNFTARPGNFTLRPGIHWQLPNPSLAAAKKVWQLPIFFWQLPNQGIPNPFDPESGPRLGIKGIQF